MGRLSPEEWATVEQLFGAASALPPGERGQWLDLRCPDPALRMELDSLLSNIGEEGSGISSAVMGAAVRVASEADPESRLLGKRLGPYRIEGIIGRGGMGAVYSAVRDDEQYSQKVAVKLVRVSAASRESLLRFRQERQILARLEHANIARLLDGGTTAEGVPFLAMEYVEGLPLPAYCDERRLSINDRLRLMLKVCDAVDFAHRNLIVHRDIKPGNILVSAAGEPKLLDFGIAKLLDDSGGSETATQTGVLALTPEYASPEQIRGEVVSTATDVYSLGAVMYEVLSGVRAHRFKDYTPAGIAQTVCTQEMVRPSSAAGSQKLRHALAGDLDTIVLMAMRKEPERRYRSVAELAADIGRYLGGRPVSARPDTFHYRAGKFLRRNCYAAMGAVLLLAVMLAGVVSTLYQARRAEHRFQQVRALAKSFLFDVDDKIANLAGSTPAREFVVQRGLAYLDNLAAEPGQNDAVQLEAANGYLKIGDVLGNKYIPNLGKPTEAIQSYDKAIRISLRMPESVALTELLARAHLKKGQILESQGVAGGADSLQRAIQLAGSLPPGYGVSRLELLRSAHYGLSRLARITGDLGKELANAGKMLEFSEQLVKLEPTDQHRYDAAIALEVVALGQTKSGDLDTALAGFEKATNLFFALHQKSPDNATYFRDYVVTLSTRASFQGGPSYTSAGDSLASERLARMALDANKEIYGKDPSNERKFHDLATSTYDLGGALRDRDPLAAVNYLRQSIAWMDAATPEVMSDMWYRIDQANFLMAISYPLRRVHRFEEARTHLDRSLSILRELQGQQSSNNWVRECLAAALLEQAALRDAFGQGQESEAAMEALQVIEPAAMAHPDDIRFAWRTAQAYAALGDIAGHKGNRKDAREWYAKSLQVWTDWKHAGRSGSRFLTNQVRAAQAALDRVQ